MFHFLLYRRSASSCIKARLVVHRPSPDKHVRSDYSPQTPQMRRSTLTKWCCTRRLEGWSVGHEPEFGRVWLDFQSFLIFKAHACTRVRPLWPLLPFPQQKMGSSTPTLRRRRRRQRRPVAHFPSSVASPNGAPTWAYHILAMSKI